MSDDDAGAAAPEPVKRGPGRPRKEETVSPPATLTGIGNEPLRVRMTRDIQMPKHYFAEALATDPKMQRGEVRLMKPEWAAIMLANGKVERA